MIQSNAFNFINVLDKASDASWVRNELISSNIANAETPNYKRKDVEFENLLKGQMNHSGSLRQKVKDVNLNSLSANVYTDNSTLSYRSDGNNVDIDTESTMLAENQIRYNTLLESMNQEFSRLKTVLQSS